MQKIHLIERNESAKKVAHLYKTNSDVIFEGTGSVLGKKYFVLKDGDEDIKVIENYNTYEVVKAKSRDFLDELKGANFEFNEKVEVGNFLLIKKSGEILHSVMPLEKLGDIAKKYSVSVASIINDNNLKTEKLFIGQILRI